MRIDKLMPCGKKDCTECETCKYDLSLDTLFKRKNKMKDLGFGLVPVGDNPATAQLILPAIGKGTQLVLPFKDSTPAKDKPFCNNCEHFVKIQRPNKNTFNTRCSADNPRPGGAYRVVKLNVYPEEKVRKPFWCPILKQAILGANPNEKRITVGGTQVFPSTTKADDGKKEKWLSMSGIMAWSDIEIYKKYHLPPTLRKGRMDICVKNKFINSIQCEEINTGKTIWLYKDDEEYKFLSPIK
jgi:hypothetical protein